MNHQPTPIIARTIAARRRFGGRTTPNHCGPSRSEAESSSHRYGRTTVGHPALDTEGVMAGLPTITRPVFCLAEHARQAALSVELADARGLEA